ncbi:MAG: carboxypeptidase-like regulatory domain-containing protein [Planctomycetaceae bacterium]|nr:carboxypeptidase-like regulatory domain-containing protein [Planctomycetaceae bacterium]
MSRSFLLPVVVGTWVSALLILGVTFAFAKENDSKPAAGGRFPEKMVVTVVDEAGNPITHADGFHRFGKYVNFHVDDKGVFEIPMSEEQWKQWQTTDITVRAEGYGPYTANFESDLRICDTWTVVLKPAQKIGGIVVDEEGQPVEGVKVTLTIHYTDCYNCYHVFRGLVTAENVTTDAEGRWSFFQLPATFSGSPSLSLEKEGYLTTEVYDIPAARLNPDADGNCHTKITIEQGYTFSGRIVDENGAPIEGAAVRLFVAYRGDTEPVLSDQDGLFRLENCSLNDQAMITVWASGRASLCLPVEIRSEDVPLEITMPPGRGITLEVKDSAGNPIPDVSVSVAGIAGLPGRHYRLSSHVIQEPNKTDEQGKLTWNEGPASSFEIVCSKRDYIGVQFPVDATQELVPVTLFLSKVTLRIVDDVTGEPIPAFHVTTRMYEKADDENYMSWTPPSPGNNGFMETDVYGGKDDCAWRFDVEAPGYATQKSRIVTYGEENVELAIRLSPSAENMDATATATNAETPASQEPLFPLSGGQVLTPEGENAENATVTIAVESSACGPDAGPVTTDAEGRFILSDDQHRMIGPQKFILKITHASGSAVIDGETFRKEHDLQAKPTGTPITLLKWGRVEGTLQAGTKTLEGTVIAVRWQTPDSLPTNPGFYLGTVTKKDGRFVFEQVMPGTVKLSRTVTGGGSSSGWSTYTGTLDVKPGETTYCVIGGTGKAVVGRAVVSEPVEWLEYTARIVPKPENMGDLTYPVLPREYWPDREQKDPYQCNIKRLLWETTEEGRQYKEQVSRYNKAMAILRFAPLRPDGTFRFDDLPPGDYVLVISETINCGMDSKAGNWRLQSAFTIDDPTEEPLDFGELMLKR